jgi:WS/DGAT/MGAT family acyltransferase
MARPMQLLDLVFLLIDRAETPANVGAVMLFDPPPGTSGRQAARRIVRAFRAARPSPPFDTVAEFPALGLPHWRTVPDVDLKYHVRYEHLAAPGNPRQLYARVAGLHPEPMDRSRPLFRVHVFDGLESGQLAIYVKLHHANWDGRSAMARLFGTLATEPGPLGTPFFARPQEPAPPPPAAGPVAGLADGARTLVTQALAVRELLASIAARGSRAAGGAREAPGNRPFAGPHTRFNQPVSAERAFAPFSLPIDEMRRVARAFDGKLNDVVLAVVDAGVDSYLASLGERARQPLVAMCPVSLRDAGDVEATTKVATMFVPLGQPRSGAARRMRQITANTAAAKKEFRSLSKAAALDYAALAFGLWFASHALGMDAVTRPVVNLVISNVGGLPGERYLGDLRLAGAYPVSMVADPTGLNVSAISLGGRMDFGIVANRAAVPDAGEIARRCLAAWQLLRKAAVSAARARQPSDRDVRTTPVRARPSRPADSGARRARGRNRARAPAPKAPS